MHRRVVMLTLLVLVLAGCADTVHRYRTAGLTENQRTDVELFEVVARFARDSFGGPLLIDPRLSNSARWPTVGLEPDGSRADATITTDARRAVMRRLGIPETDNASGSGCVIASAWEVASREHEYHCPETPEVRVGIGPFYGDLDDPGALATTGEYWASVARIETGPTGFVFWRYHFQVVRRDGDWVVGEVRLKERIG